MNVTFNTYNNKNLYTSKNKCNPKPQTFTAREQAAAEALNAAGNSIANAVTGHSNAFDSISKKYDSFCNWVGEKICRPVFDNRVINGIADKVKDKDNAIKFFLIGGSAITSGVYVQRTLTNDKMDKDRRKTLAVNQTLTFLLSTLGALVLDSHLKEWWGKKKEQYFDLNVPNAKVIRNAMEEANKKIEEEDKNLPDTDKRPLYKLDRYLKEQGKKHFINAKDHEKLMTKMDGFSALRSIIVFALVYRFLVPILVTKPANILCEKYLEHKKAKDAMKNEQA